MANIFRTKRARGVLNVIFSVGAAVIIFGALAKIQHWGGAWGSALTIGMISETFVFLLMAFQPADEVYHWEKYYPHLNLTKDEEKRLTGEYIEKSLVSAGPQQSSSSVTEMDQMLKQADITPDHLKKLGENFQKLDQTVSQMSDLSGVVAATGDFSQRTGEAAAAMGKVTNAYSHAAKSMEGFNQAVSNGEELHQQLQTMTKNLGSLNAIYEMEMEDTNNHLKAMNRFYSNISEASENMAGSVEDAQKTKEQIALLAKNMESLNTVYGNMLSAMSR